MMVSTRSLRLVHKYTVYAFVKQHEHLFARNMQRAGGCEQGCEWKT